MADTTLETFPDTVTVTETESQARTTERVMTLRAPMIQLNYRSQDIKETAVTRTSSPSNTSTGGSDSRSGLSTGAQAGIGVGVALAGLALIGAFVLFFLRRRKQRPKPSAEIPSSPVEAPPHDTPKIGGTSPAYTSQNSTPMPPSELGGQGREYAELPAGSRC